MDRILYKEADGDITCRSRDFDKIFPTLYAYEELEMTPEDIKQTLLNFGSFLCEITGGRMSKTNYTVQAMVDEAYANFERGCDECTDRQELAEIKKELEQVKQERDALLATLKHYAPCEECGHWDMEHEMCRCHTSCLGGEQWIWRGAKDTNVPSKEE